MIGRMEFTISTIAAPQEYNTESASTTGTDTYSDIIESLGVIVKTGHTIASSIIEELKKSGITQDSIQKELSSAYFKGFTEGDYEGY